MGYVVIGTCIVIVYAMLFAALFQVEIDKWKQS